MKKTKFLSVMAVGALLLGTGLTSCAQEPITEFVDVYHYGVSITSTTGGTVTPSKETAKEGEEVTLTIVPETNFKLSSLKINGTEKASEVKDNKLTLIVEKTSIKVEAAFTNIIYKVNIDETTNGTITSSITEGATGTTVTLSVTPDAGYELATFTVDGTDKLAELVNGTFETTIGSANIAVAATFVAQTTESLLTDFTIRTKKASELETSGIVNKAHYVDVTAMTTDTTYEKFVNEAEGEFNLITTVKKNSKGEYTNKTITKNILKDESLYSVNQSYNVKDGAFPTEPTRTELSSKKGTSIETNEGQGYLPFNFFGGYAGKFSKTKLEKAKNLKFVFEGSTTKVSYDEVTTDWQGNKTYTLIEGTFAFDGEKITQALEKVSTYSTGFTVEADGKVTIEEEATPKITSKELTLEYGEAKAEPESLANLKYGSLATTSISEKCFEIVDYTTEDEIANLSNLYKSHSYKVKLQGDKGKIFDKLTYELVPDRGQDASKVNLHYSSWTNEISINPTGTFSGTLKLSTFNATKNIPISVVEPELQSIELGILNYSTETLDKTGKVKLGQTLDLAVNANPLGSNDKVAFTFSGTAAKGCKVVSQEAYGGQTYTFYPGTLTGEVTVKAISVVDSSIVSNDFVVTIEDGSQSGVDYVTLIPGFYRIKDTDDKYIQGMFQLGDLLSDVDGYSGEYSYEGTTGSYFFIKDGVEASLMFGSGVTLNINIDGVAYAYTIYGFDVAFDENLGTVTLTTTMLSSDDANAPELTTLTLVNIM